MIRGLGHGCKVAACLRTPRQAHTRNCYVCVTGTTANKQVHRNMMLRGIIALLCCQSIVQQCVRVMCAVWCVVTKGTADDTVRQLSPACQLPVACPTGYTVVHWHQCFSCPAAAFWSKLQLERVQIRPNISGTLVCRCSRLRHTNLTSRIRTSAPLTPQRRCAGTWMASLWQLSNRAAPSGARPAA